MKMWHVHSCTNLPLQIEAVRAGQRHVQQQTTGHRGTGQGQKLLCRAATLDIESGRRDQLLQRPTHVIVFGDDEDRGRRMGRRGGSFRRRPAGRELRKHGRHKLPPICPRSQEYRVGAAVLRLRNLAGDDLSEGVADVFAWMEDYAVPRRRNTLETATVDLNFSVGFELCRGQHHHL